MLCFESMLKIRYTKTLIYLNRTCSFSSEYIQRKLHYYKIIFLLISSIKTQGFQNKDLEKIHILDRYITFVCRNTVSKTWQWKVQHF